MPDQPRHLQRQTDRQGAETDATAKSEPPPASADGITQINGQIESTTAVTTVPLPAPVWLLGSATLALLGFGDAAGARYNYLVSQLKLRQAAGNLSGNDLLPIDALLVK